MKEYRIARGWRIFTNLLAITVITVGLCVAVFPVLDSPTVANILLFTAAGLVMLVPGIYLLYTARKCRIVITDIDITDIGVFTTQHLLLADIEGYTTTQNFIALVPADSHKPTIKLYNYIEQQDELRNWVSIHFANLEVPAQQAATQQIVTDERYGATAIERLTKLEQAHTVAKVFNTISGVLVLWAFAYPPPYEWVCMACLLFPVISLLPYYYYRGLIKLDDTNGKIYPHLLGALLVTPLGIMIRTLKDFELLDYTNIWSPACVFAACFMGLLYLNRQAINTKSRLGLFMGLFITMMVMAYGYAACVFYNCYYDKSYPQRYTVTVLSKSHSSTLFNTSYYLNIAPWGHVTKAEEYQVKSDLYENVKKGDTVNLYLRKGNLHAPWIDISK